MNVYTPILVLGLLAFGFAAFSVTVASITGPKRYNRAKLDAYECGIEPTPAAHRRRAVPDQVLPDGDALHRLRHRDRVPLPVGGRLRPARALRRWSRWSCSSSPSSSSTPTCGAAADSSGTDGVGHGYRGSTAARRPADDGREGRGLRPQGLAVAGHLRPGLLRHRDDGHRRPALRHRPLRHGGLPRLAAPGRPDDRGGPGEPEDGPGAAPDLRPDGRAQVGASRWACAPPAAACSTTTRSSRASTTWCRSTSTCPAARRGPRCCFDAILKLHEKIQDTKLGRQPRRGDRRSRGGGR